MIEAGQLYCLQIGSINPALPPSVANLEHRFGSKPPLHRCPKRNVVFDRFEIGAGRRPLNPWRHPGFLNQPTSKVDPPKGEWLASRRKVGAFHSDRREGCLSDDEGT